MPEEKQIVQKERPAEVQRMHTSDTAREEKHDVLGGRFEIQTQNPLPEFSNQYCNSYVVIDAHGEYKNLYALVGVNEYPFRDRATEAMQRGIIPNLIRCHATGPVTFSETQKTHRVFILQRPKGKKLRDILKHSGPLPDSFISTHIIRPINRMLVELEAFGINHGSINIDTVYYDNEVMVEDCCALPSGILQNETYEAPERLMCMDAGKGAGDTSGDYYSLGILALHLYLGHLPNSELNRRDLIDKILVHGAYNAFVPEVELSDSMQDFLRGTINENRIERWDASHMQGWIIGKRYSAVAPSEPRDSVRAYGYDQKQFFTRKQIANHYFKDWKKSKANISGFRLMRWLESNIKKTDVCAQVDRVIPIGDDDQSPRALKDEELSRLLSALDPEAPIRYRMVSFNIDGLGPVMADLAHQNNQSHIAQIIATMDNNIISYSDKLLPQNDNPVSQAILWRLQGLRPLLKTRSLGFGHERVLYQLNPSLCCQQQLLLPHYCYTVKDVLSTLDALSARHAKKTSLIDPDIAAFLTNRLEYQREIKITELGKFPDLVNDQPLIMLKILALSQQKMKNLELPGLGSWVYEMLDPTIEKIKQRSKREKLRNKLQMLSEKGSLDRMSWTLLDKSMFAYDRREHSRADALFRFNYEMLTHVLDRGKIRLKSRIIGQQIAWFVSIMTLMTVVVWASRPYM